MGKMRKGKTKDKLQDKYRAVVCISTQCPHLYTTWESADDAKAADSHQILTRTMFQTTPSVQRDAGRAVWTVPGKFCYLCTSRNERKEGGQGRRGGGWWWRVSNGVETRWKKVKWMAARPPLAEAVWQGISLIPLQSEAPFSSEPSFLMSPQVLTQEAQL